MAVRQDPTLGSGRRSLRRETAEAVENLQTQQRLTIDTRRSRPSYFDGRFLAARDLVREQTYSLVRQAEFVNTCGAGVYEGLDVQLSSTGRLQIGAGYGITGSGECVNLDASLTLEVGQIPEFASLGLGEGLSQLPNQLSTQRNGAFAVVLRAVEFARGEATVYPTTVQGSRGRTRSEIQEAVAVALVRLSNVPSTADAAASRAELAHAIFTGDKPRVLPSEGLALAAVWLDNGTVRWLDVYLVRREIWAGRAGGLGLQLSSSAQREAFRLQYQQRVAEVLLSQQSSGSKRFVATDWFRALPPAGPFPRGGVNLGDFTQSWFPPEMTLTLSVVSDAELAARVDAASSFAPIDLSGRAESLDNTRIDILLPLSPQRVASVWPEDALQRARSIPLVPGQRSPHDVLALILRGAEASDAPGETTAEELVEARSAEATWRRALAESESPFLWYVRARTLELTASVLFPPPPPKEAKEKEKEDKEAKEKEKEDKEAKEKEKEDKEAKENIKELAKDNIKELAKDNIKELAKDNIKEDVKELAKDNIKEDIKELAKDNIKDSAKEFSKENLKEALKELEVDPGIINPKDLVENPVKDLEFDPGVVAKVNEVTPIVDVAKVREDAGPIDVISKLQEGAIGPIVEKASEGVSPGIAPVLAVTEVPSAVVNLNGGARTVTGPGLVFRGANTTGPSRTVQPGGSRTFIQPSERPQVGNNALVDPTRRDR